MRKLLFAVTTVLLAAVVAAAADPPKGHLVLIGGGDKPDAAMRKFVELAGGPAAPIAVLPTASELKKTGPNQKAQFEKEFGCTDVTVVPIKDRAQSFDEKYVKTLAGARGIFFSGGDQALIIRALRGTPAGDAVATAFAAGAVVGGTSAGTACQSPLMITGNGDFKVIKAGNVELWEGLGFFTGVIVDQHFVARQRQNRLISVILEHPELLGVGVDEDTAVWVKPDRTFEVIGASNVIVIDAAATTVTRAPAA
ncbi:MAG: Cyanophycinase, partial [Acidobacteria bacterium]|nr:Cyanophycinase [Acidobacteriota bacterium]